MEFGEILNGGLGLGDVGKLLTDRRRTLMNQYNAYLEPMVNMEMRFRLWKFSNF